MEWAALSPVSARATKLGDAVIHYEPTSTNNAHRNNDSEEKNPRDHVCALLILAFKNFTLDQNDSWCNTRTWCRLVRWGNSRINSRLANRRSDPRMGCGLTRRWGGSWLAGRLCRWTASQQIDD